MIIFLFFYQHSGSLSYDPYFPMSNLFFMRPRYLILDETYMYRRQHCFCYSNL